MLEREVDLTRNTGETHRRFGISRFDVGRDNFIRIDSRHVVNNFHGDTAVRCIKQGRGRGQGRGIEFERRSNLFCFCLRDERRCVWLCRIVVGSVVVSIVVRNFAGVVRGMVAGLDPRRIERRAMNRDFRD